MKISNRNSVDGFVPRRVQRSRLGGVSPEQVAAHPRQAEQPTPQVLGQQPVQLPRQSLSQADRVRLATSSTADIDEDISNSLKDLDIQKPEIPRGKRKKSHKKRRKLKIVILVIVALIILVGGFLLYKAWVNAGRVFGSGNLIDLFQNQPLKMDAHGRSNMLILGTTDDDPDHPGATLTDSMMVLSVDQKKHDAYMFSIPRDLYVQFGRVCNSGRAGKINEYFDCVAKGNDEQSERKRMDATREFVGKIFGMDLQYVAHVNAQVIKDAVNAVGGVTVNVQSDDPRGVFDPSVDWMCREKGLSAEQRKRRCSTGHYIHFKNGPNEMDGDKALYFSRARGALGGSYGLDKSNFDREKNQQLVLMALKNKAASTGTLTDLGKVTALMDAMGKNLRTNVDAKEVRTVMDVASKIKDSDIHRLSFIEKDNVLLGTSSVGGASVVVPTAGQFDYSQIRSFIKVEIYGDALAKEKARVLVLNGSGVVGAAKSEADRLKAASLNVVSVGNSPQKITEKYKVYQLESGKSKQASANKIKELYGVTLTEGKPPFNLPAEADFVVIIGP